MKRFGILFVAFLACLSIASDYADYDVSKRVAEERNPYTPLTDEYIAENRASPDSSYRVVMRSQFVTRCMRSVSVLEEPEPYTFCRASFDRRPISDADIQDMQRQQHEWTIVDPAAMKIRELAGRAKLAIVVVFGLALLWELYRVMVAHVFPVLRLKSAAVTAAVETRAAAMRGDSTVRSAAREIDDLSRLREHGVITQEEFEAAKSRIAARVRGDAGA